MDSSSEPDNKLISIIVVISLAVLGLIYCTLDSFGLCNWQWNSCCCCCYYINEDGDRVRRFSNSVRPASSSDSTN